MHIISQSLAFRCAKTSLKIWGKIFPNCWLYCTLVFLFYLINLILQVPISWLVVHFAMFSFHSNWVVQLSSATISYASKYLEIIHNARIHLFEVAYSVIHRCKQDNYQFSYVETPWKIYIIKFIWCFHKTDVDVHCPNIQWKSHINYLQSPSYASLEICCPEQDLNWVSRPPL